MTPLAIAFGFVLGAGLATVLVLVAAAPTPVDLQVAVDQATDPNPHPHRPVRGVAAPTAWLAERARAWRHPWLALPAADLDLLEQPAQSYCARRLRGAGAGLAAGAGLGLAATGLQLLPATATAIPALAGGVLGGMWPYLRVREDAAARRERYRRVLAVYLDLVAQERSAGRAATPALREAAEASQHPLFRRIRATVTSAHRHGHTPWHALRALGTRIRLPELVDVADLADTAADGAAIATSLHTKATALRHAALTRDIAEANSRSERLTVPVSLLLIGLLGLVLYPTVAQLLTA